MAATTPPGAERREEADKAGTGYSAEKTLGSQHPHQTKKQGIGMLILEQNQYARGAGYSTLPGDF